MAAPAVEGRAGGRQCPDCGQRFTNDGAFCPYDGAKLLAATFSPPSDALLGSTIDGRYEVTALLGEGGMGQVYEVRHVALERLFAMKVLKRELARDTELAARFIDEARATASIHHPNVVQITDFGQLASGAPYFVMELLVGQTLGHVIKTGGPVPADRGALILQGIAAALAAAHEAGIVHRDLKPDNVFLVGVSGAVADSSQVRVVDFGAAKIVGSSRVTRQGIVFGTPHYMSPEQASGQPVDLRADIYALGVIMYEMFTGRVPFEADTYMGVLTQHMFVQPTAPSALTPAPKELGALEDITLTCLAKKPEGRFSSMAELAEAIAAVVDLRDGSIAPHGALAMRASAAPRYPAADGRPPPSIQEMRAGVESLSPPMRRPPWGWIAGAGAVVALAGGWALLGGRAGSGAAASATATSSAASPRIAPARATASATPTATVTAPGVVAATTPPPVASTAPAGASTTPAPTSAAARAPVASARARPPAAAPLDDVGDPFSSRH